MKNEEWFVTKNMQLLLVIHNISWKNRSVTGLLLCLYTCMCFWPLQKSQNNWLEELVVWPCSWKFRTKHKIHENKNLVAEYVMQLSKPVARHLVSKHFRHEFLIGQEGNLYNTSLKFSGKQFLLCCWYVSLLIHQSYMVEYKHMQS